jgi:hypothetical protein
MIRICSDCKYVLGEKEPFEDKRETHGLCQPCMEKLISAYRDLRRQKPSFVDRATYSSLRDSSNHLGKVK